MNYYYYAYSYEYFNNRNLRLNLTILMYTKICSEETNSSQMQGIKVFPCLT
jgi:hypothetical protein